MLFRSDFQAFPECYYGLQCAVNVFMEIVEFFKAKPSFKEIGNMLLGLVLRGFIGCLQPCFVPYGYYSRYSVFFTNATIEDKLKSYAMSGAMSVLSLGMILGQTMITEFINGKYHSAGFHLGLFIWGLFIR